MNSSKLIWGTSRLPHVSYLCRSLCRFSSCARQSHSLLNFIPLNSCTSLSTPLSPLSISCVSFALGGAFFLPTLMVTFFPLLSPSPSPPSPSISSKLLRGAACVILFAGPFPLSLWELYCKRGAGAGTLYFWRFFCITITRLELDISERNNENENERTKGLVGCSENLSFFFKFSRLFLKKYFFQKRK